MGCDASCFKSKLTDTPRIDVTEINDTQYKVEIPNTAPESATQTIRNLLPDLTGIIWRETTDTHTTYTIIFS